MAELGIRIVHAHSPQAKGRVERVFKTLQDRLVKEMRIAGTGYLIRWRGQTYVLAKRSLTVRRQKVTVLDRFDGRLSFRFKGRELDYRPASQPQPAQPRPAAGKIRPRSSKYIPPPDHPWRHMIFGAGHAK